ncbi:MAG: hypothetical protein QG670_1354 [Thermoproteota archaeon]|nr:hypothetical protein [Thermoproteota archaeon]
MGFPKRIYTLEEFTKARKCVEEGYRHRLRIVGSTVFKDRVDKMLKLIRKAGYYNYLRTYIRQIIEIDGVSQLREAEATIWLNSFTIKEAVEGARLIVQKTEQMKDYLSGEKYYERGELQTINKSVEFLKTLVKKRLNKEVRRSCEEVIKLWTKETIL